MAHILVVDDEPNVASSLRLLLERGGYQTSWAADGRTALELLKTRGADLVLLDVNLGDPLMDGLAVCRAIRSLPAYTPVIMLTIRDGTTDKVVGLEVGADDYITKPYDERELLARIRATFRMVAAARAGAATAPMVIDGALTIDPQRRKVLRNNAEVMLTPREFDLLVYLASHAGQPFGREMLLDRVWGWDVAVDTRTVDKHIAELRRKLETDPANPRYILTVRGVGYAFREW
jgi:DNA-binding response OmpR family regulator